ARAPIAGWTPADFGAWSTLNNKVYQATKNLLFEYKNMEPCATYVWNEWRGANEEELAGKGERSAAPLLAKYLLAGGGGTVKEAAAEKWAAMLDLADYASKLIDGTSSGLDGPTLWRHIQREVAMVEEDAPELLTEMVHLSGLFPSAKVRGTKATAQMKQFEEAVKSGTVNLTQISDLLRQATVAGAFTRRPVSDSLFPQSQPPPDPSAGAE